MGGPSYAASRTSSAGGASDCGGSLRSARSSLGGGSFRLSRQSSLGGISLGGMGLGGVQLWLGSHPSSSGCSVEGAVAHGAMHSHMLSSEDEDGGMPACIQEGVE